MNLNNQHLLALKTTKIEYKKKLEETDNPHEKEVYQQMINELTHEEKKILNERNILLDKFEKGD